MVGAVLLFAAYVVFILAFVIGVCWLWPDFVDTNDPPRIRKALSWMLALQSVAEVGIWFNGSVRSWVILIVFITNAWGMLDAILRFPVIHDIDSLFGLKQVALIAVKLAGYALGFDNIGKNVGWFILVVLSCVFSMPILWLTALPFGDVSVYAKTDAVDEDLAHRLWKVAKDPVERAAAMAYSKKVCRQFAVQTVKVLPFMKPIVCKIDPALSRVLASKPSV